MQGLLYLSHMADAWPSRNGDAYYLRNVAVRIRAGNEVRLADDPADRFSYARLVR